MTKFTPSSQQTLITDTFHTGQSFIVSAAAGTGKTTTLKLIALLNPNKFFLYVVFNKQMRENAALAMPKNVECRTGDSLSWIYVSNVYRKYGLELSDRVKNKNNAFLIRRLDIFKWFKFEKYRIVETKIVDGTLIDVEAYISGAKVVTHLVKAIDNYCISEDRELNISHFPKNISYPEEATIDANLLWADIKSIRGRSRIKLNHVAKLWALQNPDLVMKDSDASVRFDAIMIDEAQDTNPVFGKVYRDQKMQRIYVGDHNQAIYGFRGAEDEMEKVDLDLSLDLNESWRFGPAIAEIGNKFLDLLEEPKKIIGKSSVPGLIEPSGTMENPNVVICRSNAGALRAIFERILVGQRVVVPSAYKKDLMNLLDTIAWFYGLLASKPASLHQDLEEYSSLEEIEEAMDDGDLGKKILELASLLSEKGHEVLHELLSKLNGHSKDTGIQVTTAHKSKGGEWDRVQIYDDFWGYRYDKETRKYIIPKRDELMLAYVAVTRAKEELDLGSLDYILKDVDELNEKELQKDYRLR